MNRFPRTHTPRQHRGVDTNVENNGGFMPWAEFKKQCWDRLVKRGWKCCNSALGEHTFHNLDRTVRLESRRAVAECASALFASEHSEGEQKAAEKKEAERKAAEEKAAEAAGVRARRMFVRSVAFIVCGVRVLRLKQKGSRSWRKKKETRKMKRSKSRRQEKRLWRRGRSNHRGICDRRNRPGG